MLPMGLATIIGGMSTTIGTSTNLLVVGISQDLGMERFGMFDFMLPVALVGGVGIAFLWLVAPRLLPDRDPPMADTSPRVFSSQLYIKEGSFADGKSLSEVLAKTDGHMRVDRIQRSESLFLAKLPSVILQPGDRLFVKDSPDNLKHFERELGATLYNVSDIEHPVDEDTPLQAEGQQLGSAVAMGLCLWRFTGLEHPALRLQVTSTWFVFARAMFFWFRAHAIRSTISKPAATCSYSMERPICRTRIAPTAPSAPWHL
jgi:hypothetical protein